MARSRRSKSVAQSIRDTDEPLTNASTMYRVGG